MSILSRIDDFLIDRVFQPAVDWLARWATPCAVAEFLLVGNVLARVIEMSFTKDGPGWLSAIVLPIDIGLIFAARYYERTDRVGALPRARLDMNWWRYTSCPFAVLAMTFVGTHFVDGNIPATANNIASIALFAAVFFMACRRNPPPPKRETAADLALEGAP